MKGQKEKAIEVRKKLSKIKKPKKCKAYRHLGLRTPLKQKRKKLWEGEKKQKKK